MKKKRHVGITIMKLEMKINNHSFQFFVLLVSHAPFIINFLLINQGHKAGSSIQLCTSSKQAQIPEDHCVGPSVM